MRFRVSSRLSSAAGPRAIIACGGQVEGVLATLPSARGADLILVHPLGKPPDTGPRQGRVSLVLPMLDTHGTGRRWKAQGRRQGWQSVTSHGVGQDVRLVWPGILEGVL